MLLRRADLRAVLDAEPFEGDLDGFSETMSRKDAAHTANLCADKVVPLLRDFPTSHGAVRTIPVTAALEISGRYVFLRELAVLSGLTASAMAGHVARFGIPAGPANGFDRARVAAAGLLDLRTSPKRRSGRRTA